MIDYLNASRGAEMWQVVHAVDVMASAELDAVSVGCM